MDYHGLGVNIGLCAHNYLSAMNLTIAGSIINLIMYNSQHPP